MVDVLSASDLSDYTGGALTLRMSVQITVGCAATPDPAVSIEWLADAVEDGRITWVLTDGTGGGMRDDGRVGSSQVMAAAAQAGTPTSVDGLYDLRGHAADLRALAG